MLDEAATVLRPALDHMCCAAHGGEPIIGVTADDSPQVRVVAEGRSDAFRSAVYRAIHRLDMEF